MSRHVYHCGVNECRAAAAIIRRQLGEQQSRTLSLFAGHNRNSTRLSLIAIDVRGASLHVETKCRTLFARLLHRSRNRCSRAPLRPRVVCFVLSTYARFYASFFSQRNLFIPFRASFLVESHSRQCIPSKVGPKLFFGNFCFILISFSPIFVADWLAVKLWSSLLKRDSFNCFTFNQSLFNKEHSFGFLLIDFPRKG